MMGGLGGFGNVGIRSSYQNQRSLAVSGGLTLGEGGVLASVGLDGGGRGERPCLRCDLTHVIALVVAVQTLFGSFNT